MSTYREDHEEREDARVAALSSSLAAGNQQAEQRHVEGMAATLTVALIATNGATCRDACEEGLALAREIIRMNRGAQP